MRLIAHRPTATDLLFGLLGPLLALAVLWLAPVARAQLIPASADGSDPPPPADGPRRATPGRRAGEVQLSPGIFNAQGQTVPCDYGVLWVPSNHDEPEGDLLELAFVRFPAVTDTPGSPIVYLAGGPGGSGVFSAKGNRFALFMELRKAADVIAFDQRGTGKSQPGNMGFVWTEGFPLDQPGSSQLHLPIVQEQASLAVAAMVERGIDLKDFTTVQSARDLELLRVALESDRLSLWGISYGTHLALATARLYGDKIERMILAGVEGPDHSFKRPGQIQSTLEGVAELCRNDPVYGPLMPDLVGTLQSVLDALEAEPVTVELIPGAISVTVGKWDVQRSLSEGMGSRGAMERMPAVVHAMSRGEFFEIARWAIGNRIGRRTWTMSLAMDCASYGSRERIAANESEGMSTVLGNTIDFPFPGCCEVDGLPRLDDDYRKPIRSDIPTLFISGTMDGRTPLSNAEELATLFTDARHLIIERAAHSNDLFLSSPEIATVIVEFAQGKPVESRSIDGPEWSFATPYERSLEREILSILSREGYEATVAQYRTLREQFEGAQLYDFDESVLNDLGYQLLTSGYGRLALGVFMLNTEAYPEAYNAWDSLAECYAEIGDTELAIRYYQKSLALNPDNGNARTVLQQLQAQ